MRNILSLLLLAVLPPLSGWAEELPKRDSTQFADFLAKSSYEGNELPHEMPERLFARRASGSVVTESVAEGCLTFQTESPGTLSYQAGNILPQGIEVVPWWTEKANAERGYTVEFRLKALTGGYTFNFMASPADLVPEAQVLVVTAEGVWWGKTRLDNSSNHDDFHLFRIVRLPGGNLYQVWRDGIPIGNHLSGEIMAENRFWFGDWGGKPGGGVLDYLRWDTTGAYQPTP